jgi:phage shock protein A
MATLLEKFSVLIRADLHSMIDRSLSAKNVAVLEVYIRDAQTAVKDLQDAVAAEEGQLTGIRRRLVEERASADSNNKAVDTLLLAKNEKDAGRAQRLYEQDLRQITLLEGQSAQLAQDVDLEKEAIAKLEFNVEMMKEVAEEIRTTMAMAVSTEKSNSALEKTQKALGSGDVDFDNLRQSAYRRLDTARSKRGMLANDLQSRVTDAVQDAKTSTALEERKKRLGLSSGSDVPALGDGGDSNS